MNSGLQIAVAPKTRPIFAMFEPMALPIAILVFPSKAAMEPTSISGAEVAMPTTVKPMIRGGIFHSAGYLRSTVYKLVSTINQTG